MNYSSFSKREILNKVYAGVKTLARVPMLVAALLLSVFITPSVNAAPTQKSISKRVELVRDTLKRKSSMDPAHTKNLSYSERRFAQWGNWGNWGNWNNWINWNNWNNWRNWNNWGNWGNL